MQGGELEPDLGLLLGGAEDAGVPLQNAVSQTRETAEPFLDRGRKNSVSHAAY